MDISEAMKDELTVENVKLLKEQIDGLNKEKENLVNMLKSVAADFDNYKKRNQALAVDSKNDGKIEAVIKLLPMIDGVNNAMKIVQDKNSINGMKMVVHQFEQNLEKLGFTLYSSVGKKFDPNLHNAVTMVESDGKIKSGHISQELECGVKFGDKVVRYASVIVVK